MINLNKLLTPKTTVKTTGPTTPIQSNTPTTNTQPEKKTELSPKPQPNSQSEAKSLLDPQQLKQFDQKLEQSTPEEIQIISKQAPKPQNLLEKLGQLFYSSCEEDSEIALHKPLPKQTSQHEINLEIGHQHSKAQITSEWKKQHPNYQTWTAILSSPDDLIKVLKTAFPMIDKTIANTPNEIQQLFKTGKSDEQIIEGLISHPWVQENLCKAILAYDSLRVTVDSNDPMYSKANFGLNGQCHETSVVLNYLLDSICLKFDTENHFDIPKKVNITREATEKKYLHSFLTFTNAQQDIYSIDPTWRQFQMTLKEYETTIPHLESLQKLPMIYFGPLKDHKCLVEYNDEFKQKYPDQVQQRESIVKKQDEKHNKKID